MRWEIPKFGNFRFVSGCYVIFENIFRAYTYVYTDRKGVLITISTFFVLSHLTDLLPKYICPRQLDAVNHFFRLL